LKSDKPSEGFPIEGFVRSGAACLLSLWSAQISKRFLIFIQYIRAVSQFSAGAAF